MLEKRSKTGGVYELRGIHTEVNDKLDDLEASDPLLPPDTDAASALEVVPVHDDMNRQVEGDRNP